MIKDTNAADFFRSTVKPTVDEFFANPLDVRRGRLAAIVLYHMADYWDFEVNHGENVKDNDSLKRLYIQFSQQCPDFLVIRDVADASKHRRLRQQMDVPRKLTSAAQVKRITGTFNAPFNTACFNKASVVEYELDDGTKRPLLGAVRSVLWMWEDLVEKGTAIASGRGQT